MKSNLVLILILLINNCICLAQEKAKSPSSFFPEKKATVLVAGCFHFDYPGLDMQKTSEINKIDVLKDPKKQEVTELINYIKKFKPNKIAIEAFPDWDACGKLRKYKKGEFRDKRDERYQIAMRIATELYLDTLYSIDTDGMIEDVYKADSNYVMNLAKDFDFESNDSLLNMTKNYYNYEDQLPGKLSILNYFKHMNSKESHRFGYGAYLVGDFRLDKHRGADFTTIWWYNRNLRIFRNIQDITNSNDDRILVLFGNGHAAILRQLLECSPEFEFVEFDSLK